MDEAIAEIKFDGVRFGAWQNVDVRESVDDLCASVSLSYAQAGVGDVLGLTANSVVEVLIGNTLVTTTRSDLRGRKVAAKSHTFRFSGRSLGRELVDCQYSLTLKGLKLGEIVKRICGTFNVPVKIDADTAVVPEFSMQCELPANALINAARAANLLLYPQPDGGLVLTEPTSAAAVATLEYGQTIEAYDIIDEDRLRFSNYVVKSFDYEGDAALSGSAKDAGISFFRPMHIVADRHGHGQGGCDRRALFERNRRLARAHRIELDVSGWRYQDAAGNLVPWAINTQVRVMLPDEGIDGVFLIGERAFRLDAEGGKKTTLQVMSRDAFLGEEKKKSKRGVGAKVRRG